MKVFNQLSFLSIYQLGTNFGLVKHLFGWDYPNPNNWLKWCPRQS